MDNRENDVVLAFLKLSRAMRRCPPEMKNPPFPPAVGRMLDCAARNPRVSSRELCEILDLRPSSLSEMLSRAEADGLITRAADEADRRVQRIDLSPKGRQAVEEMEEARERDARKKTACLNEEEKALFCELCSRLSAHLEKLALDLPEGLEPRFRGPRDPEDRRRPPFPPPEEEPGEPGPEGRPPLPPGGRFRC